MVFAFVADSTISSLAPAVMVSVGLCDADLPLVELLVLEDVFFLLLDDDAAVVAAADKMVLLLGRLGLVIGLPAIGLPCIILLLLLLV